MPGGRSAHCRKLIRGSVDTVALPGAPLALTGCARRGAPSFVLFGAFFPAWMLCAVVGIFAAIGARAAFVASGLSGTIPFQLFVSVSVGVIFALLVWLIWFGSWPWKPWEPSPDPGSARLLAALLIIGIAVALGGHKKPGAALLDTPGWFGKTLGGTTGLQCRARRRHAFTKRSRRQVEGS
ncbi:MAG: hypothetical protein JO134_17360, partial [Xanthobacteraceae bacterium]|nr:hypothetical protein [Xanthobacteraceae bacterium]